MMVNSVTPFNTLDMVAEALEARARQEEGEEIRRTGILEDKLEKAEAKLKQAEQLGFEKHKLAVVTMFRMKAAGMEPQLAAILSAWADMIGEIEYDGKKT